MHKRKHLIKSFILSFMALMYFGNAQITKTKKILFVVTSHDKKGSTNEPTGYYLGEVSHPWEVLYDAGYEIDFVSPKGGTPPVDALDLTDSANKKFWENSVYKNKIDHSKKPTDINSEDYAAIFYAGGHGAMWDFSDNKDLQKITKDIYQNGGIVAAVCHGPAGLVNVKLDNGKFLVDGKKISGFTNDEENAVKLEKIVPFLLETTLIKHGAIFEKSANFTAHVNSDQRVITGQNPQSAKQVGEEILKALEK